jgi:redox-sensitive bicupin YhaK (pirin superfamily)
MSMQSRRRFLVQSAASTLVLGMAGCTPKMNRKRETIRQASAIYPAASSADGAGVRLRRALGHRQLPMLDPFLLLDELHSNQPEDYQAGFPEHPHRGFETVSYLIRGAFEHRDSVGNHGTIGPGDCQWMTAGRGIIHAEMPQGGVDQELWGLQLWVNLPAAKKMIQPRYQDRKASEIPELDLGDARVRVVTGSVGGAQGPVDEIAVAPTMMQVNLPVSGRFDYRLPAGDNCFAYMLQGSAHFGAEAKLVADQHVVVLSKGERVLASSEGGAQFLLFSATPIGEPVARRGPFVMNTQEELRQAFADYRSGRLVDG